MHTHNTEKREAVNLCPEAPHLVLASDVPHCELDVLVLHGLDVEACGACSGRGSESIARTKDTPERVASPV